jgi:N-acetylmuramoyl-L-alanine amidase
MRGHNINNVLRFLIIFLIFVSYQLSSNINLSIAEEFIDVKDIRHITSKGYTRVIIELSEAAEFSKNRISDPDRLYFDLKNSKISKEINTKLPVGDGILKTIRAGQFTQDTVRVVLDLEEIKDFSTFVLDEPSRLIIDVYGKKAKKRDSEKIITKIVLDPGHGGHDPGAVGKRGLYEKDVVLDIGLKLRKILSKNKNVKVFMTRDKDVFIPLEARTAFANSKGADIFISIHANASPNRTARGIETYILNWTDEEEAIRVAARENAISLKRMKEHMKRYKSEVDMILADLARDNKREESLKLAGFIQESITTVLSDKYNNIKSLGVKGALFYVLLGAEKIPSILTEVSFISNPVEERLLSRDVYRNYIANAIAKGIDSYIASVPLEQRMAERR